MNYVISADAATLLHNLRVAVFASKNYRGKNGLYNNADGLGGVVKLRGRW